MISNWLDIVRGDAPLIVSIPHAGDQLCGLEDRLVSPWRARKDADWWLPQLYDFAADLGATVITTKISRTVIDMNRDPSGASLYPGQSTTALCPLDTFDGEPLYRDGHAPDADEIDQRLKAYHAPYHAALRNEMTRLRMRHHRVTLYDAHSIRSRIPRLFEGELAQFNIGTHSGQSCGAALTRTIETICDRSGLSRVTNGRFKGGWITRHYGQPSSGAHALQMELACRGYMDEPDPPTPGAWPTPYCADRAAPLVTTLAEILNACLSFGWSPDP
jgi:formiminoglutamase